MHLVLNHLEDSNAYAQVLFIDFSSAFNTIQPYVLIKKLKQLGINATIIHWYHSFLTKNSEGYGNLSVKSKTKILYIV